MSLWFRMYSDVINDPKVMRLPEAMRWHWVAVLCCAAKNDGAVPATRDLAFMLRINEKATALILTELCAAGLLDKIEDGFIPHNWDGRQFKSDVSTDRVKKFRKRQRNVSFGVSETPPEQKQSRTEQNDDADEAPSRGRLIGDAASVLAGKLLVIAGHSEAFWPPGWCGAPLRVQTWLNQGWSPEIIEAAVRSAAARKSGDPAESVQYFEKAIAAEIARQAAPLPVVNVKPQETVHVEAARNRPESLGAVANRLADAGISFGPKPKLLDPRGRPTLEPVPEG